MNHRLSNPTDLLALIAQGESETIEFKRSVAGLGAHHLPEPVLQEMGQDLRVTFLGPGDNILDLIPDACVTDLRTLNQPAAGAGVGVDGERGPAFKNREYREMFGASLTSPPIVI